MDKQHILSEIKRTAQENRGTPLGRSRFLQATGIREADWRGKYWENFGDAQEEAGFSRNKKQEAYNDIFLIEKLIALIPERNRFPPVAAMRMKTRADPSFPNQKTFERLGESKLERVQKLRTYCVAKTGYEDVTAICDAAISERDPEALKRAFRSHSRA